MNELLTLFPQYALYITATVTVASLISTVLPPPNAGSTGIYSAIYRIVNTIALAFGHATNANDPKVAGFAAVPAVPEVPAIPPTPVTKVTTP
jgi:hypothetical protein